MKERTKLQLFAGLAAGLIVGGGAVLMQETRRRQLALARQAPALTEHAVRSLGIEAHRVYIRGAHVTLHAVVAGPQDAPLALLLHGFPECWHAWQHQIPALVRMGYRVIAPDQRGYNLSEKPADVTDYSTGWLVADARALIRGMGHERAVVIGHDWGGVVAWRLAMNAPEMVTRLVVMNAPHPRAYRRELRRNPDQRRKSWYVAAFQIPWLPETLLSRAAPEAARAFFRKTTARRDAFSAADLAILTAAMAQPGAMRAAINWYRAATHRGYRSAADVITTPTLLIWGEDDVALDIALTHDLTPWVPNLQLHTIPNCGHWVQNEAPEEVNARLLTFLSPPSPR